MRPASPAQVYFPSFNGIRFIAASAVVCHHIEQFKSIFGFSAAFDQTTEYPQIYQAGRLGVALFFVLSGFLITYLLLAEKQVSGRIATGNFYVRRILRIWPLYFLIIGLSFFVFPRIPALYVPGWSDYTYDYFWPKLGLFVLVMPNVAITLYHEMAFSSHTWSIGVEEQFYLIWPWLIGSLRPRRTLLVLGSIALILAGAFFWIRFGPGSIQPTAGTTQLVIADFLAHFRIGAMAIGGIGAYLVFIDHSILKFLFKKWVQAVVYAVLAFLLVIGYRIPGLNYEGYALFFVFLLMNLAHNPNSIINLENRLCTFMGRISYGVYMYHPVIIVLCLYTLRQLMPYSTTFSILLYVSSYVLTTLVAWLSYEYFEKQFLKLKDRFAPSDKPVNVTTAERV
jgi:peptidoglycan/LPS O-acetylase OafA/YrhL